MTSVTDLEYERIKRECWNPYELGEQVDLKYSQELCFVLESSFKYLFGSREENIFLSSIPKIYGFFLEKRKKLSFDDILNENVVKEAEEYFKHTTLDMKCRLTFDKDVSFLNEAVNEHGINAQQTCQLISFWFADSFVKFYNGCHSPIQFPPKSQIRRDALMRGDQELVQLSNERSRLFNFPSYKYKNYNN